MDKAGKTRGLGVTHATWEQARDAIRTHYASYVPVQVVTLTPEMCVRSWKEPEFREVIASAGIVVADGVGVAWGERHLTGSGIEKIPGIDIATWALEEVDRIAGKVYLVGAKEEVITKACGEIAARYPRLEIAGWHHGYFGENEEDGIVSEISSVKPHLLLVGMGSPRQEYFIHGHLGRLRCGVAIGIGGSFDVWSGKIRRAPEIFRKTGTEWMYRIMTQPGERIRRIPELMEFTWKVITGNQAER